jgi:hypothetical protein
MQKKVLHKPRRTRIEVVTMLRQSLYFSPDPVGVKQKYTYRPRETGGLCDNSKPSVVRTGKPLALIQSDAKEDKAEE